MAESHRPRHSAGRHAPPCRFTAETLLDNLGLASCPETLTYARRMLLDQKRWEQNSAGMLAGVGRGEGGQDTCGSSFVTAGQAEREISQVLKFFPDYRRPFLGMPTAQVIWLVWRFRDFAQPAQVGAFPAVWLVVNCKNGISSYEIMRHVGITQKSAWFMLHRIRVALRNRSWEKLGSDGSPIEVDETFMGGKYKNMHRAVVGQFEFLST